MYCPAVFTENRPEVIRSLIAQAGLVTLVTTQEDGSLEATPLPVLADDGPDGLPVALLGHLARGNPLTRLAGRRALAIISGLDAYVTPSWYPGKAEHGKVVPTWNYQALHLHGRLEVFTDPEQLRPLLERLTDRHEAARPQPWAVSDAPADYLAAQLRGIAGIRLVIDRIEAKSKLSQNRSPADQAGVRAGLAAEPAASARALASLMPESEDTSGS